MDCQVGLKAIVIDGRHQGKTGVIADEVESFYYLIFDDDPDLGAVRVSKNWVTLEIGFALWYNLTDLYRDYVEETRRGHQQRQRQTQIEQLQEVCPQISENVIRTALEACNYDTESALTFLLSLSEYVQLARFNFDCLRPTPVKPPTNLCHVERSYGVRPERTEVEEQDFEYAESERKDKEKLLEKERKATVNLPRATEAPTGAVKQGRKVRHISILAHEQLVETKEEKQEDEVEVLSPKEIARLRMQRYLQQQAPAQPELKSQERKEFMTSVSNRVNNYKATLICLRQINKAPPK